MIVEQIRSMFVSKWSLECHFDLIQNSYINRKFKSGDMDRFNKGKDYSWVC